MKSPTPHSVAALSEWRQEVHRFFHAPVDARQFAAIRIGYSLLMLVNVACWWPDLDRWFSNEGVLPLHESRQILDSNCLTLFQILPTDRTTLHIVFGLFVTHLILLLIGWKSRWQAVCCYVWLVSFQHRNSLIFEGEDTLFRIIGFLLILMPLDAAWSVDAALSPRPSLSRPPVIDGWPLRLLQLQMTMLYFSAAWSKLLGEPWRDGTALYYVMQLDEYWGRFPLPTFVSQSPTVIRLLTWGTMGLEFAVPVLIWFAPTRRFTLGLLILFHLGCDYAMHLFLFHWIMLVGWMSFIHPDDLRWPWPQSPQPSRDATTPRHDN